MAISQPHLKLLWGRAAGRCSAPSCHEDLTPQLARSGGVVLGEMAHVIGREPAAPRSDNDVGADDSYDNLILLCPNHHTLIDKAEEDHSIALLRRWKSDWEAEVQRRLLANTSASGGSVLEIRMWCYFNFDRLLWLFGQIEPSGSESDPQDMLRGSGLINSDGFPLEGPREGEHRSIFETWPQDRSRLLQRHFASIVERVIREKTVLDIQEIWGMRKLQQLLYPGALAFANRGFRFKTISKSGECERRRVRCQAKNIELLFEIDTWNAYSESAITLHFRGNSRVAALLLIRSVERVENDAKIKLQLKATPLALGTGFCPSPATDRTPPIAYAEEWDEQDT